MNHIYAPAFNAPVDWVRLKLPDYPLKIKEPMDLGTIKFKLENDKYSLPEEVIRDIRLVWKNAQTYNPPANQFNRMSKVLSEMFESWLSDNELLNKDETVIVNDLSFNNNFPKKNEYDLDETDYDKVSGQVIELSVYERTELKNCISSLTNPIDLETVIKIVKTDPKYKSKDLSKKLEFDVSSLSKNVMRKLFKFINSIPNLKKIAKKDSKKIDPKYQLKQINTKLSNEFGNNREELINSVLNNKIEIKSEQIKDNTKDQYYSKLLEDSSSSTEDEDDSSDENQNLKNENEFNSQKTKVMWNWNPNAVKKAKISPTEKQKSFENGDKYKILQNGRYNNFKPPTQNFNSLNLPDQKEVARLERERQQSVNFNMQQRGFLSLQKRFQ
ncbi:hypothetical protein MHBO_002383 [Bonamia ostreae]